MKLPYIRKPLPSETFMGKKYKWVVCNPKLNYRDWCYNLCDALRFWFWHLGVSPKIAFGWFKRKKK